MYTESAAETMKKHISIAIDGPGGAGKSTVAKRLAAELGILYLDTGAMYRACGLKALDRGLDLHSKAGQAEAEKMLAETVVDVRFVAGEQRVFLDGVDVSDRIRTPAISRAASDISALPACRLKLVELQQAIARAQSVVMDGRDIGSYVLPDADLKIYLTATVAERAARRYEEMRAAGKEADLAAVQADLRYRDEQDKNRSFAPLVCCSDAHKIDSTDLDIDGVVRRIKLLYEAL